MRYKGLAGLLGVQPIQISILLKEGLENQYSQFLLPAGSARRGKQRGRKDRTIFAPKARLKGIQRRIGQLISSRFEPHPIAQAYARGRSIITNAEQHIGARAILHIDLANFFGSIKRDYIVEALGSVMTNISESDIENIADFCCYNGSLPTGSPASPILSNLVCFPLDDMLQELASSSGCIISRFSDDVAFSTTEATLPAEIIGDWTRNSSNRTALGRKLSPLFELYGFEINWKKVRVQFRSGPAAAPMRVTGCNVDDERVTVPRKLRDNVRASLHQWDRRGLSACTREHVKGTPNAFVGCLRGRIAHIGRVEGKESPRFQRLLESFEALRVRDQAQLTNLRQTHS